MAQCCFARTHRQTGHDQADGGVLRQRLSREHRDKHYGVGCVCNVPGSWQAWKKAGFPVEKESDKKEKKKLTHAQNAIVPKRVSYLFGSFALLLIYGVTTHLIRGPYIMEENLVRTFKRDSYGQMGGYVKRSHGFNAFGG